MSLCAQSQRRVSRTDVNAPYGTAAAASLVVTAAFRLTVSEWGRAEGEDRGREKLDRLVGAEAKGLEETCLMLPPYEGNIERGRGA